MRPRRGKGNGPPRFFVVSMKRAPRPYRHGSARYRSAKCAPQTGIVSERDERARHAKLDGARRGRMDRGRGSRPLRVIWLHGSRRSRPHRRRPIVPRGVCQPLACLRAIVHARRRREAPLLPALRDGFVRTRRRVRWRASQRLPPDQRWPLGDGQRPRLLSLPPDGVGGRSARSSADFLRAPRARPCGGVDTRSQRLAPRHLRLRRMALLHPCQRAPVMGQRRRAPRVFRVRALDERDGGCAAAGVPVARGVAQAFGRRAHEDQDACGFQGSGGGCASWAGGFS